MAVEFGHWSDSLRIETISIFCVLFFVITLRNVKRWSSLTFADVSHLPVIKSKICLLEQHLLTFKNRGFEKDWEGNSCSFSFLSSFDLQCTSIGTFWGVDCSWRISIQDVFCEYKKKKEKKRNRKIERRRDYFQYLHETRRVEPVEWSGGDVLGFLANGISAVTFIIVDEEQFDGVGRRWGTNHLFTRENFTGGAAFVERVASIIDDQHVYREQW